MVSRTIQHFPSHAKHSKTTLSERIRMARRFAGLSQAALAKHSSVTASAVAQWEHPGGTRPSLDRLKAIAQALQVPVDWLVSGADRKPFAPTGIGDAEPPAVVLDVFAQTSQEEELLTAFRRMGHRAREHLLALAREFPESRRSRV